MIKWAKVFTDSSNVVITSSFAEGRLSGRAVLRYFASDSVARKEINKAIRTRGVEGARELARKAVWNVCNRRTPAVQAIVSCTSHECGQCESGI